MALSYFWGTKPLDGALRLLRSTIEQLSQDQPVDNLPKTFRDAISIAERFGVHYIWIDRLCIFQDSAEDWAKEASSMQDVYKNAHFGLAALGAENPDDGCFFQRDVSKVAPTIVRFKLKEDEFENAFRFELDRSWSWLLSFENEPLLQRSWVVQERVLSPRTLHFGRKQVFWECSEAGCCETHPRGVGEEASRKPELHHSMWKELLDGLERNYTGDPYKQLFSDWGILVNYYVSRKLTMSSDKLVAISGLANDMKARLQQLKPGPHRYLAGIWEENLMAEIAWNVLSPAIRPSDYRAPSWSWACLDGRLNLNNATVFRNREDFIILAGLVSAEMVYAGKEDTGAVESGTLTLMAPCAMAQCGQEILGFHESEMDLERIGRPDEKNGIKKDESLPKRLKMSVLFDTMDDIQDEVFILWVEAFHWHEEKWDTRGIALKQEEGNKYRRLGLASGFFASKDEARAFIETFPTKRISII